MAGALPQAPTRWNAKEPICFDCRFVSVFETGIYAMAQCQLMPEMRPFGLHWAACRKFQRRADCSRFWNDCAKTAQRRIGE